MKLFKKAKFFVLAMVMVFALIGAPSVKAQAATRLASGYITSVNSSVISVVTNDGNYWTFYGSGYHAGQSVIVVFETYGTPSIYDDAIVNCY